MRSRLVSLLAGALALGGCFDLTTDTTVRGDGTAAGTVEIAISSQLMAMMASLSKDQRQQDPLADCEKPPRPENKPPPGVRWIKGVRGVRGEMMTCTIHFEIDDPVETAKSWKPPASNPNDKMLELRDFRVERLNENAYRLNALLVARLPALQPDRRGPNPFEGAFAAMMLNRYITVSLSAARIENTTGELSDNGRKVTWKLPFVTLMTPPPGYRQEIRADIIYRQGWFDRTRRWLGLD